ncbi:MAG TPA: RES family NAD+ phosphorylase [Longimicrobium sp.]|jgi:hypothetical protein
MPIVLPRKPPVAVVAVMRPLWRVHRSGVGALWFGARGIGRFDDPALGFGVCYLGETPGVAVLETLVRGSSRCVVDRREWEARSVSRVHLSAKLRVLQFEGSRLPEFGIGADRAHAGIYDECQRLAADVHATLPDVDGIQFRSRWDPSRLCWAIFERAAHKIAAAGPAEPLAGSAVGDEPLEAYPIIVV